MVLGKLGVERMKMCVVLGVLGVVEGGVGVQMRWFRVRGSC